MDLNLELKEIIDRSSRIVFFGGAGVSTESNIPDFRSSDGLYKQKRYPYPAEVMLSSDFFYDHTKEFYDFYFHEMIYPNALPNHAHKALASLEKAGKLQAVITQNIDGLHQAAGSQKVYELHGSVHRNRCLQCAHFMNLEDLMAHRDEFGIPRCPKCGGLMKPEVVLYGEGLDMSVMQASVHAIQSCDTLIIGGTSLVVYPAAGLIRYFHGDHLVLINKDHTEMDHLADLVIHDPIAGVLAPWDID